VQGRAILERFVHGICGCGTDWVMGDYIAEAVERDPRQVGDEEVILGLSGGVDSSVAAALIHKAIGDQLTCVFVDHGLLRLNEGDMVMDMFARNLGVKVIRVDAVDDFMGKLAGVSDPEQKRKIIGKEFVEVFQAESKKLVRRQVAGSGHDLPGRDRIRRQGQEGRSHHQEPPQRWWPAGRHAPEAARTAARTVQGRGPRTRRRARLAARNGLSPPVPRPGPGCAHSWRGQAAKAAHLLQRADAIFIDELRATVATERDVAAGACTEADIGKTWYDLTSQAFAVFLPVKSVGVMGDGRTYENVVALARRGHQRLHDRSLGAPALRTAWAGCRTGSSTKCVV
jgi:GMP synthase (glutamine-hydrolysing)